LTYLIPSLASLLAAFRPCFRAEAFDTFRHAAAGWLLCLGSRPLSEVWQHSDLPRCRHFSALYHLFADARWGINDLGLRLAGTLIARFAPEGRVWLVADDTLCHKRGRDVALASIFYDPVLSGPARKALRFGVNQVVLGLSVPRPGGKGWLCLPLLSEPARKKGTPGHVPKPALAARMAAALAAALPGRSLCLVGDSAYANAATLRGRPANLHVLGPITDKAVLYAPAGPPTGRRGRPRKRGARPATPREMFADTARYRPRRTRLRRAGGPVKVVRTQEVADVLWYAASGQDRQKPVLVRDPVGRWKDRVLLTTDAATSAAEAVEGYQRRWAIEVTSRDCKQPLGLAGPQVRKEASVVRAHGMAYLLYSLVVLWYAEGGADGPAPSRERPWYTRPVAASFADMLGTLRLAMWRGRFFADGQRPDPDDENRQALDSLLNLIAAVR
jgi:hypothetical protein